MDSIVRQVELAKETSEIFDGVAGLIEDIKAGKPIETLVAENLAPLMEAVSGFQKVPEEMQSDLVFETVGVGVAKIAKAIIK